MQKPEVNQVTSEDVEQEETEENLFTVNDSKTKSIVVPMLIEDIPVEMQLDAGCSLSLIPKVLMMRSSRIFHFSLQM